MKRAISLAKQIVTEMVTLKQTDTTDETSYFVRVANYFTFLFTLQINSSMFFTFWYNFWTEIELLQVRKVFAQLIWPICFVSICFNLENSEHNLKELAPLHKRRAWADESKHDELDFYLWNTSPQKLCRNLLGTLNMSRARGHFSLEKVDNCLDLFLITLK